MKALIIISIVLSLYLLSLFIRAILIPEIKEWKYKRHEKKLLKKGLRPFFFEHGRVHVFAKTEEQANARYKEMKYNIKKVK